MAEQPSMGSGKIHNGWRKSPPLLAEILALAEKFRAMVSDNFPGKFRRRQVVVLRHALSGLELCGILLQCCLLASWTSLMLSVPRRQLGKTKNQEKCNDPMPRSTHCL